MGNPPAHRTRKRFGQNFLHDAHIIQEIIRTATPSPGDHFIEIGPGQGALTFPLLSTIGELTAIELDRDLIPFLEKKGNEIGSLKIIQTDALNYDFAAAHHGQPLRIIGNLPYNISTPLIFHLLKQSHLIQDMHFMLQKEVVDRICAEPGSKAWGKLSVMTQVHCSAISLFEVPPEAFDPPPKVQSAIVHLTPYPAPKISPDLIPLLNELSSAIFNQRRKTLRNSLKKYFTDEDFNQMGLDASLRPEHIMLDEFIRMTEYHNETFS